MAGRNDDMAIPEGRKVGTPRKLPGVQKDRILRIGKVIDSVTTIATVCYRNQAAIRPRNAGKARTTSLQELWNLRQGAQFRPETVRQDELITVANSI